MRKFYVVFCCLALALGASAKQEDNNNQKKKKGQPQGQGPAQQQHVQHPQGGQGGKHQGKQFQQGNAGGLNAGQGGQGGKGKHHEMQEGNLTHKGQAKEARREARQEKIQAKHFDNLSKGPKAGIESEKFVEGRHIHGSEHWEGEKYVVFRDYHSEWHDHDWWYGHYGTNLVLIAGGWYFLNGGYWAPAWGYNPAQSYYPYDGPIYAYHNLPPDQVIANVQASLQAQGYYEGDVDGLLGPLTRAALARYQADHGLIETSAIDEPTLASLGMA